jgi:competence protein ComEC
LAVSFIALGHGSSVLIELPRGESILYDAGRMGPPMSALQPISAVLWSKGITHLDAVIVTHADVDHFNAIPGLLERFSVGRVLVSPTMFQPDVPALQVLRAALRRAAVPVRKISVGARHRTRDGVELTVLHPPKAGSRGGDNSNSIALEVRDRECILLLTGDLESDGLDQLLEQPAIDVDVLLAPHHGSRLSRPSEVVAWTQPEVVIISAGAGAGVDGARFQADFGANGARVLWTHRDGMVQLNMRGKKYEVWTHRGGPIGPTPSLPSHSGRLP